MHIYKYFLERSLMKSLFHQEYRVQFPVPLVLSCIHLFLLKMFSKYCNKIFSEFLKIFQGRADLTIKLFLVVLYMSSINCVNRILRILLISPYSVRMRENAGKMRTRITSNTDTFYAVLYHYSL